MDMIETPPVKYNLEENLDIVVEQSNIEEELIMVDSSYNENIIDEKI